MWHLGLPTLFSSTFAYSRIANEVGVSEFCIEAANWQVVLESLKVDSLGESIGKTESYINETHTKKILVEKWQRVFEAVLAKNV